MTIQKFIETAIEGGWKPYFLEGQAIMKVGDRYAPALFSAIALDPKAWEAVGKVKGWVENDYMFIFPFASKNKDCSIKFQGPEWQARMIMMTFQVSRGKTLESYIETL